MLIIVPPKLMQVVSSIIWFNNLIALLEYVFIVVNVLLIYFRARNSVEIQMEEFQCCLPDTV